MFSSRVRSSCHLRKRLKKIGYQIRGQWMWAKQRKSPNLFKHKDCVTKFRLPSCIAASQLPLKEERVNIAEVHNHNVIAQLGVRKTTAVISDPIIEGSNYLGKRSKTLLRFMQHRAKNSLFNFFLVLTIQDKRRFLCLLSFHLR